MNTTYITTFTRYFFQPQGSSSQNYAGGNGNGLDFWQSERPVDMANIVDLEVMCGKSHMEVKVTFDKPFNGIIFSKVLSYYYNCMSPI